MTGINGVSLGTDVRLSNYRFYLLNATGLIDTAQMHRLRDDAAALAYARALTHDNSVEVWQQDRRIGLVPPSPRG